MSELKGSDVANVKHCSPTLVAQVHISEAGDNFSPFIGTDLNYAIFSDKQATAALKNTLDTHDVKVDLKNSFGLALQAGFNYTLNSK